MSIFAHSRKQIKIFEIHKMMYFFFLIQSIFKQNFVILGLFNLGINFKEELDYNE